MKSRFVLHAPLALLMGCSGAAIPTSTTPLAPGPAALVAQGQAAVAAAGGAITDVGAAACLAQGILAVVPVPATQAAAVATGLLCNWTNPTKTALWYARWHHRGA